MNWVLIIKNAIILLTLTTLIPSTALATDERKFSPVPAPLDEPISLNSFRQTYTGICNGHTIDVTFEVIPRKETTYIVGYRVNGNEMNISNISHNGEKDSLIIKSKIPAQTILSCDKTGMTLSMWAQISDMDEKGHLMNAYTDSIYVPYKLQTQENPLHR